MMNSFMARCYYWVACLLIIALLNSCGKKSSTGPGNGEEPKTPQELLNEGWAFYEQGDYQAAIGKFNAALEKDNTLWDAHNGIGWCKGKLGSSSEAITNFLNALGYNQMGLSAKGGLAFAYNAQGQYDQSNSQAEELLTINSQWSFEHDSDIDWRDVILVKAQNYFALGDYAASLQEVKKLNPDFDADVSTVSGIAALAAEIERLRGVV